MFVYPRSCLLSLKIRLLCDRLSTSTSMTTVSPDRGISRPTETTLPFSNMTPPCIIDVLTSTT